MKIFSFLILIVIGQNAFGQTIGIKVLNGTVPSSILYQGKIVNTIKYADVDGEHWTITTETGIVNSPSKDEDLRNQDLYAYNYKINGGKYTLVWQMHDFIRDCPFDIRAKYIPGTFAVTDLNHDGKAETWLMYRTVCHSDVSPSTMKIMMYEDNKKYAVRGTNKVKVSIKPLKYDGGEFTFDQTFKTGPEVFRKYAEGLWKANLLEKWD